MKAFLKAIFSNLHIKLLAVLVAAGVWVYVVNAGSQIGTLDAEIPIDTFNLASNLGIENLPGDVEVTVRAEQNIFSQLTAKDFTAFIDLTDLEAGTHEVEVRVVTDIPGVQIIEKNPETVSVVLSGKTIAEQTVTPKLEGEVAKGFVAGSLKVDPEKATVEGAKKVLERVKEVRATVKLNGEEAEFTQEVQLVALDTNGNEITNVKITPPVVTITIPVERADDTKTVGIKTNIQGTPPSGFSVGTITTEPQAVTLRGKSSDLEKVQFIETEAINVESATSSFTRDVNLTLPEGIELQDVTTVKVSVEISQTTKQRSLNAEILFVGADSSLRVSSKSPSTITVVVSGSESVIDSISDDDVKIEVDLQGKSAGTFNVSLSTSNVSAPSNVRVVSINPQSVSVTLVSQ